MVHPNSKLLALEFDCVHSLEVCRMLLILIFLGLTFVCFLAFTFGSFLLAKVNYKTKHYGWMTWFLVFGFIELYFIAGTVRMFVEELTKVM